MPLDPTTTNDLKNRLKAIGPNVPTQPNGGIVDARGGAPVYKSVQGGEFRNPQTGQPLTLDQIGTAFRTNKANIKKQIAEAQTRLNVCIDGREGARKTAAGLEGLLVAAKNGVKLPFGVSIPAPFTDALQTAVSGFSQYMEVQGHSYTADEAGIRAQIEEWENAVSDITKEQLQLGLPQ